ncbi:MAG: ABC transporter substrate-binding protein [Eubacteriales bacterium]|nr:ABC transporter substrate-binding protein [Eubacteriales bacterium]
MKRISLFFGMLLCLLLCSAPVHAAEEPTITVAIASFDSDSYDYSKIEQELDKYVYEKLGFHVNMEYLEYISYGQEMNTYLLQGQFPDVYLIIDDSDYNMLLQNGYLFPLDDLLDKYGKDLSAVCSEQELLSHTEADGFCYGIPCIHGRGWTIGFEYRVSIAEKYGLDMENIHTVEDLGEVFAVLKEKNPDIVPLGWTTYCAWDMLPDTLGVLMNMGHSDKIENLYETEEYENLCLLFSEWREKGYMLNTDYVQTDFSSYVQLEDTFGKLADYNPAMQWTDAIEGGEEFNCIPLSQNTIMSNAYNRNCWVISSETEYPRYAMEFLNLLYTDKTLPNLLAYGTHGNDYEFTDSNCDEIRLFALDNASLEKPIKIRNYLVGNQYLCYRLEGFPEDIWDQAVMYDQNALISNGYGFEFDDTPVSRQVQTCQKIVDLYDPLLMYGTPDAKEVLASFREELKEAGIGHIIAEKQKQFNEWKAKEKS